MTKEIYPKPHHEVYIFVAIDIPYPGAQRAFANNGIEHFFDKKTEVC